MSSLFDRVHVLIGTNKKAAIIGFYKNEIKIKQMYMFKNLKLKEWFPKSSKFWREKHNAKVTISKLKDK